MKPKSLELKSGSLSHHSLQPKSLHDPDVTEHRHPPNQQEVDSECVIPKSDVTSIPLKPKDIKEKG